MPGGRYNLNTIGGIEKKIASLANKKQDLLNEVAAIDKELDHLTKTVDGLKNAELIDAIKKSGKSMDEIRTALGV